MKLCIFINICLESLLYLLFRCAGISSIYPDESVCDSFELEHLQACSVSIRSKAPPNLDLIYSASWKTDVPRTNFKHSYILGLPGTKCLIKMLLYHYCVSEKSVKRESYSHHFWLSSCGIVAEDQEKLLDLFPLISF